MNGFIHSGFPPRDSGDLKQQLRSQVCHFTIRMLHAQRTTETVWPTISVFPQTPSCYWPLVIMVRFPLFSTLSPYPYSLQSFVLLVKATVDVSGVEQRVSSNLAQQVSGKVADVVLAEVPLHQHSAGNHRLGILMAALAEVAAEVFTVTQSLNIV